MTTLDRHLPRWTRRIGSAWHGIFVPGDLSALIIAVVLLLMPALSLSASGWPLEPSVLLSITILSVVFGFVLARSQYNELLGLLISGIYGACFVLLIAALNQPSNLGDGIYAVFSRLFQWLIDASSGGINQDDLVFTLLVSSLFAALSAFHNYIARYSYVAGREGLLPAVFGRTHDAHQSPHVGSVVQTVMALVVLAIFAGLGLDPVLNMFTWVSQVGTLGVLGMMTITSLSVIVFFRKKGGNNSPLATLILPAVSGLIMAALFVYIFVNFGDLTSTAGGALGIVLPALIPVAGIIGFAMASRLKSSNPAVYARMGQNRAE